MKCYYLQYILKNATVQLYEKSDKSIFYYANFNTLSTSIYQYHKLKKN